MIIQVKQSHIDRGRRLECRRCPIAMAVREATGFKGVFVGGDICTNVPPDHIWFNQLNDTSERFVVTRACRKFIDRFDRGNSVKPFSFRLIKQKESK